MEEKQYRIAIFDPPRTSWGGGPQMMAKIAAHLSKKYYVEVFTTKYTLKGMDFNKAKITFIKPVNKYLSFIAYLKKRTDDFDLVILGSFPANLASLTHKPCIGLCCSPTRYMYDEDFKKDFFKNSALNRKIETILKIIFFKKLDTLAAKKTDKFLAVSENIKDKIKKYYDRESVVFYPGIDFSNFKSGKYEDYVLSVARFVSHKRVDMIVKSMGYVKNKKIKLKIVGCGEDENKLRELCKNYPNVDFLGFVSEQALKDLYANCLALIYIPVEETEGYAPIEAGASEKATIGVNEGGLKETIIDNQTGFLIDNVTPEKIAEKIDFLAENPKIAIKMGKNARKFTEKFDWKNTLKVLDKEVEDLILKSKQNKLN